MENMQMVYILLLNDRIRWASRSARQIASFATKKSRVRISPCPPIITHSDPQLVYLDFYFLAVLDHDIGLV